MTPPLQTILNQVFTVDQLMTPKEALDTFTPDQLAEARIRAKDKGFDLIPIEADCRIIGVLPVDEADYELLTDRWLVSRDTPIPTLLHLFVETDQPGFMVLHGQQVVGLVTPADLNKLPVRVYIYNLIGELELKLAALIQNYYQSRFDQLRQILGEERWQKVTEQDRRLKQGDANVNPIHLLYLKDLLRIVISEKVLHQKVGFCTNNQLSELVRLRDRVMHLVRPLVEQVPGDVYVLHARVQRAQDVLQLLG